ncbi:MAG: OmpA family protein [Gammaproteobacteria bacterium]
MMNSMLKIGAALAATMFAVGFVGAATAADGVSFEQALSSNYTALSQIEMEQGNRRSAQAYAMRAAAAAGGTPTAPDEVDLHRPFLKEQYVGELSQARSRLVSALEKTGRTDAPAEAAQAQASYDCWLEQASEHIQQDHIRACKDSFLAAMDAVEAAANKVVEAPPPPPPAPEPEPSYPENFLVFFDFDRAEVTSEGMSIINQGKTAAHATEFKRIVVTGHADRAGSTRYNMALSQRRAEAVEAALARAGLESGSIRTSARGEAEPLVETADGVREPQNRRVEILIER